jgi:hypothetical protein
MSTNSMPDSSCDSPFFFRGPSFREALPLTFKGHVGGQMNRGPRVTPAICIILAEIY